MNETANENNNKLPAIFKVDGDEIELRVDPDRETIWATQDMMAKMFQVDRSGIAKHIGNIFSDGEIDEVSNVHFLHIAHSTKPVNSYTLDVILSVGYRVNSKIATKYQVILLLIQPPDF